MRNELPLSQPSQDDEIDLFELFAVLWAGKWIITAIVGISLAFGFSFSLYKKHNLPGSHFAVIAPYSVNLFRPLYTQICREHLNFSAILKEPTAIEEINCVGQRMSADLENLAKSQWPKNRLIEQEWKTAGLKLDALTPACPEKFCLTLITRSLLDPKIYNLQLKSYNEVLTESIIKEVKAELSYKFKQNASSVLASEAYAENVIKLRRLLNGIESGQMAINFEEIDVKKIMPPNRGNLMVGLSFVLGGFLGCALVLLRDVISRRRNAVD